MPALRSSSARLLTLSLSLASLWLGMTPTRAHAGLVLTVEPSTATAGGMGSFDVVLSDTGMTSYQVAAFSVELSVASNSGVKFTAADTNTTVASYIFGTLQSSSFTFNTFPNTDFIVSDSPQTGPGFVTLNPGDMVGLEHVSYSVAAGTPIGPINVMVMDIGGGTSLSDLNGDLVPFTPTNGTITVATAIPEPSSLALCGIAGVAGLILARVRRKASAG